MSSKVRVISANTMRLRLLEEQALLKHKEVVQLRGVVQRLRSQYEAEVDTDHLKCVFHDVTASVHQLRTEILASLGCNTVDDQCVKAITTNEAKYFWYFVDGVKLTSERLKNAPSLKLDELAESLRTGVVEKRLCKQCNQLSHLARTLK
ncbi:uncharacterized protein C8R40DRAFT_1074645 [Lentinula edodes]|uniref:uncharacterized protein n=1 Tax=Lentinula edodes TaxID=5353 RepID=UPI001E8EAAA0|nr:uncharacterized protein C8R40DRAFT_1074645 [Lentinula edodes]KAH7868675.1 hypothetical protein C8R40DRAFT_1074645 [Lentinula edodes]